MVVDLISAKYSIFKRRSKHLKGLSFWLSLGSCREIWTFAFYSLWVMVKYYEAWLHDYDVLLSRSCCSSKANEELVQGGEGQRKTPTLKHLKLHNWCKSHASKIHFCKQDFFLLFGNFQVSILWIFALKLTQKLIEIGLPTN